jgi:hypothetical protein
VPNKAEQALHPKSRRWTIATAIILVLAIAAGTLYWLYRPRTPAVTAIHQLTCTVHQKKSPMKTDGTRLYFFEWLGGGRGTPLSQVSTKDGDVSHIEISQIPNLRLADISDDGSQLLVSNASSKFDQPTWVYSLPSAPRRRIPGPDLRLPAFLPGAKQMVYLQSSDLKRLFTIKLDGSDAHPMLSAPGPISTLAISPDGQTTRFVVDGKVWENRMNGSGLHRFLPQHEEPILGTDRKLAEAMKRQVEAKLVLGDLGLFGTEGQRLPTFGEYADVWMRDYARVECKTSTADGYEGVLRQYPRRDSQASASMRFPGTTSRQ